MNKIKIDDLPDEMTRNELLRLTAMSPLTLRAWIAKGKLSPGRKVYSNRLWTKAEVAEALGLEGKLRKVKV
jgi:hypothetical protein